MCTTNTNEHEPNDCDLSAVKQNASDWVVNGAKIDYCLSQSVPSRCKLQFVISLLVAVFICNALKTVSMFWTLYKQKDLTLLTGLFYELREPNIFDLTSTVQLAMPYRAFWKTRTT